jgi:hypothetical protein
VSTFYDDEAVVTQRGHDRLTQLANWLESDVREPLYMAAFIKLKNEIEEHKLLPQLSCGFAACAIGHAALVAPFAAEWGLTVEIRNGNQFVAFHGSLMSMYDISLLFDVPSHVATALFSGSAYRELDGTDGLTPVSEVVKRIRAFLTVATIKS